MEARTAAKPVQVSGDLDGFAAAPGGQQKEKWAELTHSSAKRRRKSRNWREDLPGAEQEDE